MSEANLQASMQSNIEANKQLIHRWFDEVWNQQSEAAIDAMYSPQGRAYGFPEADSVLVGPEAFKQIHRSFRGAFPDLHIVLDDVICEGDHVAARWHVEMTHLGDDFGFPATGKKARMSGASFVIVKGDMITDGWNLMDMGHLINELKAEIAEGANAA